MLIKLWTSWTVLLQSSTDSLDSVRELGRRIKVLPEEAALYFYRKGCSMLFSMERAVHISVDCYDTTGSGHLQLEIGIMWHRIESSK